MGAPRAVRDRDLDLGAAGVERPDVGAHVGVLERTAGVGRLRLARPLPSRRGGIVEVEVFDAEPADAPPRLVDRHADQDPVALGLDLGCHGDEVATALAGRTTVGRLVRSVVVGVLVRLLMCDLGRLGAFVPVAFARAEAYADGEERALKTARLMAEAVGPEPFIVLADDNGTVPELINEGRSGISLRSEEHMSELQSH